MTHANTFTNYYECIFIIMYYVELSRGQQARRVKKKALQALQGHSKTALVVGALNIESESWDLAAKGRAAYWR